MKTIDNHEIAEEEVARDYVQAVLKYMKIHAPQGINYFKQLEAISNFNSHYSKVRNLNPKEIIQGENEINLAVILYNSLYGDGSLN